MSSVPPNIVCELVADAERQSSDGRHDPERRIAQVGAQRLGQDSRGRSLAHGRHGRPEEHADRDARHSARHGRIIRAGGTFVLQRSLTDSMKTLAAIVLLALALVPAATSAQATDLTGNWNATFTMTRPDGTTQSITFTFHFTQKGKVLSGTIGPEPARQWKVEKGVVDGRQGHLRGPAAGRPASLVHADARQGPPAGRHEARIPGTDGRGHGRRRARQGQVRRATPDAARARDSAATRATPATSSPRPRCRRRRRSPRQHQRIRRADRVDLARHDLARQIRRAETDRRCRSTASSAPCFITSQKTLPGEAPSARRVAISSRRCDTP